MQHIAGIWIVLFCNASLLLGWEPSPQVTLKGVVKTASRHRSTRYHDGTEKRWEEKSTVLVPDESITLSRSVTIGSRPPLIQQDSPEFIHLVLSEEFDSLKEKLVELHGHFVEPSADFYFVSDIKFAVDTAIDVEWQQKHPTQTVFYEPNITELRGTIYRKIYSGIDTGDVPETALILALAEPVDVQRGSRDEDNINSTELGVREIEAVFLDSAPLKDLWARTISVRGSLFSAHTAHHHRRVLMMVKDWSAIEASTPPLHNQ